MSKTRTMYPPVASPEAAAYDAADHSDCSPDDLEPAVWEVDPVLLVDLDREMREQAEMLAEMLGAPDDQPAVGGSSEEVGEPW